MQGAEIPASRILHPAPYVLAVALWYILYPRDCRINKYSVSARSNGILVSSGT
jgi:hypothetical protein